MRMWTVAASAGLALAGCGSSNSGNSQSSSPPPAATPRQAAVHKPAPPHKPAYGGMGAPESAFRAHNGPIGPEQFPGTTRYIVESTDKSGRVVAFEAHEKVSPPAGDGELQGTVTGLGAAELPSDASVVASSNGEKCQVYESRTLKRLIGSPYVRIEEDTGAQSAFADAWPKSSC